MRAVLTRLWARRRALALYAVLVAAGWAVGVELHKVVIPEMRPMNEPLIHAMMMGALALFVVTAAIPFVPGAEIGFAMLLAFGGQAAGVVYGGMVGALLLSYGVARLVPLRVTARAAGWLGLRRLAEALAALGACGAAERAALIEAQLSGRFGPVLLRNRFVVLGLLLNLPGNSVLGGGGGLAFLAGLSGLYPFWAFLVCILLAVAPVPLAFVLLGI